LQAGQPLARRAERQLDVFSLCPHLRGLRGGTVEAVAPTCLLAPIRPEEDDERVLRARDAGAPRRAEPAPCTWTGLEELRSEVRSALVRRATRRIEVDDIVQEALLRAARYRDSLVDPARLRAWVVRIALNVLRDQMRRDMRLPRVDVAEEVFELIEGREEIPGDPCVDDVVEAEGGIFDRDVMLRYLDRAFEDLPRCDRRVLHAYYSRDTAAGCVRESVPDLFKVHVFRARGRLARALRKRLALGAHAASAHVRNWPRAAAAFRNHRGARRAPVRLTHVQSGAEGIAGKET
jgi:RNA polymerase sigma factor (sigma-70 family)